MASTAQPNAAMALDGGMMSPWPLPPWNPPVCTVVSALTIEPEDGAGRLVMPPLAVMEPLM